MGNIEEDLQQLRLWQAAYGDTQPTEKRRQAMGLALARYFHALRLRGGSGYDSGPVEAILPIDPVEKVR